MHGRQHGVDDGDCSRLASAGVPLQEAESGEVVGVAMDVAVGVGALEEDAQEPQAEEALMPLHARREQARRSPANGIGCGTGGGALGQGGQRADTGTRAVRGSRYERYPFRGIPPTPLMR